MKLTFITNACCIYEHDGFYLLADPWLVPGAFGTWVHDPPLKTSPDVLVEVDALYISHIHPDHLCEKTLAYFRRGIPIITLRDKLSLAEKKLKQLGFTRLLAMEDRDVARCGPFSVTMFGPFTKHPFHECEIGNVVDSALLIEAGGKRVLNTNDNTFSLESAQWFRDTYGQVDVAQLNSNAAGPYPACFSNLTHEQKLVEKVRIAELQLDHMNAVAKILGAKKTMPFAGQYKLGYGLEHLNQYLPKYSDQEIASALDVPALVLAEGESYEL